jgi:ammonia channel protein AmtB
MRAVHRFIDFAGGTTVHINWTTTIASLLIGIAVTVAFTLRKR